MGGHEASSNLATVSKRSGWRGTMISRRRGYCGARLAEDVDRDLLFGFLRAAGEENDVVVRDAGQFAERGGARIAAIGLSAVVFQRAGDVDAVGRRTERAEAVGRFFVLRRDQIDLPQHAGDERADAAIAREAVVAEPAVDDRHPSTVFFGGRDQDSARAPARQGSASSVECGAWPCERPN